MSLRKMAFLAGAGVFMAIPAFASADISFDFNTVQTGGTPGGPTPWATLDGVQNGSNTDFTLTFNDFVGAGADTEFLKQLDITYTGNLGGSSILESEAGITSASLGGFTDAGIHFDVKLGFSTPNNANRVEPGETVHFTVTNSDANDFSFAMLHINALPGGGSGKVIQGVPEPASMAALGFGAFGLLARRRRNKK